MLQRKLLPIHNTLNVLLLAVFGNQVFSLRINFLYQIDYITLFKTIILLVGAILYSITYTKLKKIDDKAVSDFYQSSITSRNQQSIDDRYECSIKKIRRKYLYYIFITIICIALFFLLEPIYNTLCN